VKETKKVIEETADEVLRAAGEMRGASGFSLRSYAIKPCESRIQPTGVATDRRSVRTRRIPNKSLIGSCQM